MARKSDLDAPETTKVAMRRPAEGALDPMSRTLWKYLEPLTKQGDENAEEGPEWSKRVCVASVSEPNKGASGSGVVECVNVPDDSNVVDDALLLDLMNECDPQS